MTDLQPDKLKCFERLSDRVRVYSEEQKERPSGIVNNILMHYINRLMPSLACVSVQECEKEILAQLLGIAGMPDHPSSLLKSFVIFCKNTLPPIPAQKKVCSPSLPLSYRDVLHAKKPQEDILLLGKVAVTLGYEHVLWKDKIYSVGSTGLVPTELSVRHIT